MNHIFSESAEIAKKNRRIGHHKYNLNNWTKQFKPQKTAIVIEGKAKPLKTHCRDCGCVLEKKSSRIWGICPSCDIK